MDNVGYLSVIVVAVVVVVVEVWCLKRFLIFTSFKHALSI